jgi:hypothetical protein
LTTLLALLSNPLGIAMTKEIKERFKPEDRYDACKDNNLGQLEEKYHPLKPKCDLSWPHHIQPAWFQFPRIVQINLETRC